MEKRTYTITDINEDLIHYIDRYLKKVIINAKRRYYRYKNKKEDFQSNKEILFALIPAA